MIKVKFFSDYDGSENLLKRFRSNYPIDDNKIGFTTQDDYHFAVIFNRTNERIKPWAKTITIIQEPSWSPAHEYTNGLTNSDYLIIHNPELFEKVYQIKLGGKVIESPSFMFFHDPVDYSFFDGLENIEKQKKLSIITSGLNFSSGNYGKRIELLYKILASDLDIDIYGKWLIIDDPRFKGELEYKYDGLIPYEYSIAIENSNEKNYITEKFVDCVLCNTTPIYNGAPNIKEVYDERFFRILDFDSTAIIDDLKKMISVPSPGTSINKEIYFSKYNLYKKLKEIIYSD